MRADPSAAILVGGLLLAGAGSADAIHSSFEPDAGEITALADGSRTERPEVRALYLDGRHVAIDGRLDDDVWQFAETAGGFTEADPNRGEAASEDTTFKVAYDHDTLYFAIACFEHDTSKVATALSRRDRIDNSDIVSIYVDPYLDRTTGYNFRVNPDGVQMDQYVFNDGNMDRDWDAVWRAETLRDERGWYAEIAIPFSSVRYRPADDMTWGLQVYRWMHGRGEDTAWVNWDRNTRGFVSRFGALTGLSGVPAPRQLEIAPYMVTSMTDPAVSGSEDEIDGFQNLGVDIKYGVTADLTLNAAFQPDFGQVEADPSELNLSPFESFFAEKRPFFIEGARFFEHPEFNLVYTRRIGTGDANSRIRYAGKLTGKMAGDMSVAALFAATDVTGNGQTHNFLKSGREQSYFSVVRAGREFAEGNHRFNLMQTAVWRADVKRYEDDSSRRGRDGFSSGADFDLNFRDRSYNVQGSWVYTMVDPIQAIYSRDYTVAEDGFDASKGESLDVDHSPGHGTGGALSMQKLGGDFRGNVYGRWEHDELDPNDMGILGAPDEYNSGMWLQRRFNSDGQEAAYINQGNVNFNLSRGWLYGERTIAPGTAGDLPSGSYGRGKPQSAGANINGWVENRHRWSLNYGLWHDFVGRDRFNTRGGPIMQRPAETGMWVGMNTDWRKPFKANFEVNSGFEHDENKLFGGVAAEQGYFINLNAGVTWVQSSRLNHNLSFFFRRTREDDQWAGNFEGSTTGIGGTSYVFGRLDQKIMDITLRSNVIFDRSQSLELYVQPFVTVGNYYNARELARPDSYDLIPYDDGSFNISGLDFEVTSVNLNAVYRWEYRPGSTFFAVWTHARSSYDERSEHAASPSGFENGFDPGALFSNEPENSFLLKLSYWLPI
jgi:hypothetical protein